MADLRGPSQHHNLDTRKLFHSGGVFVILDEWSCSSVSQSSSVERQVTAVGACVKLVVCELSWPQTFPFQFSPI